jgi:hypothetical protein
MNHVRKMKSKPSPLVFLTHYSLYLEEDNGAIYIKITVATGAGDATTLVAYEDHSSNGSMT